MQQKPKSLILDHILRQIPSFWLKREWINLKEKVREM
jgi:hypothetical protein